ncbi:MAG: alpha/beta hydrolase [Aerococcus sp.]|nr:alpha/beta hydrolase [Aerococcus sp.]
MKLPESFEFKGGKRAVLLLHAYTGSTVDMRLMGRGLNREANYTTMGINFTGHATGKIEDVLTATPADWVKDTWDAIHTLEEQGHNQIAIFGLSLGGLVALRVMLDDPTPFVGGGNFSTPVLQTTIEQTNVPAAYWEFAAINWRQRGYNDAEIEERRLEIEPAFNQSIERIDQLSESVRMDLSTFHLPYFIAAGEEDELVDPDVVQSLYGTLKRQQVPVESHRYVNSKHALTVGKEHKQVEQDVIHFLDQLDWEE